MRRGENGHFDPETKEENWYELCTAYDFQITELTGRCKVSPWRGEADCPKCGGEGTLLVTGETAMIEIEGCWVCGYGRGEDRPVAEFVPLAKLKVVEVKPGLKGRR